MLKNWLTTKQKLTYKNKTNYFFKKRNTRKHNLVNLIKLYFIFIIIHHITNYVRNIQQYDKNQIKTSLKNYNFLSLEKNITLLIKNINSIKFYMKPYFTFLKKKIKWSRRRLKNILVKTSFNKKLAKTLNRTTLRRKKKRIRIFFHKWKQIKRRVRFFGKKLHKTWQRNRQITNNVTIKIKKLRIWNSLNKKKNLIKKPFFKKFLLKKRKRRFVWFDREHLMYYTKKLKHRRQYNKKSYLFKKKYNEWISSINANKRIFFPKGFSNRVINRNYMHRYKILLKWSKKAVLIKKKKKLFRKIKWFFKIKKKLFIKKLKLKLYKRIMLKKSRRILYHVFTQKISVKNNHLMSANVKKYIRISPILSKCHLFEKIKKKNSAMLLFYKNIRRIFITKKTKFIKTNKSITLPNTRKKIKYHLAANLFKYNINTFFINTHLQSTYINTLAQFNFNFFTKSKRNKKVFKQMTALFFKFREQKKKTQKQNLRNQSRNNLLPVILNNVKTHAWVFNNYFPLFLYFNMFQKKHKTSVTVTKYRAKCYYLYITKSVKHSFKSFFSFFLLNFLENFLKKKIWIKISSLNPISSFWKNYIKFSILKIDFKYKRYANLISPNELLEIIIITFLTQDLQVLLWFCKKKLEKVHFKKHKKIISTLFHILKNNPLLFKITPIKGFSFDIRGKVGVSGNAKKRHVFFSFGKISTTTQNIKSYWQQIEVWTPTGQMGITCLLQY